MNCPICKAQVEEGPRCRRCRGDLTLLFELEDRRRAALAVAYQSLAQGQVRRAIAIAEGVATLRRDEEAQRLITLCHLLRRDFARAWECYAACG